MMTTTDNLVDDDNTEAIMSIPEATTASEILPSLSSTSPSQISESTSNDSSLSTSHYYSEPITSIIETTTAEISITSSTLEQQTISGGEDLPIATTTFLPVDYSNTTKSIPYPGKFSNSVYLNYIIRLNRAIIKIIFIKRCFLQFSSFRLTLMFPDLKNFKSE